MSGPRLRRPDALPADRAARLAGFSFRNRPLPLFEALAHSDTALADLAEGTANAIDRSAVPLRLREILILRTLARWGARAEWDVHALLYAPVAPLTAAEVQAIGGAAPLATWSAAERVVMDLADALHAGGGVPAGLWQALRHLFDERSCAELLMTATQYVKVALLTNALGLRPLVPDGPAFVMEGTGRR